MNIQKAPQHIVSIWLWDFGLIALSNSISCALKSGNPF
ncbi:hypothetical protein DFQ50_102492, partial [Pseudocitrobacter faecalis]